MAGGRHGDTVKESPCHRVSASPCHRVILLPFTAHRLPCVLSGFTVHCLPCVLSGFTVHHLSASQLLYNPITALPLIQPGLLVHQIWDNSGGFESNGLLSLIVDLSIHFTILARKPCNPDIRANVLCR